MIETSNSLWCGRCYKRKKRLLLMMMMMMMMMMMKSEEEREIYLKSKRQVILIF
jgi:hypothetical protein